MNKFYKQHQEPVHIDDYDEGIFQANTWAIETIENEYEVIKTINMRNSRQTTIEINFYGCYYLILTAFVKQYD